MFLYNLCTIEKYGVPVLGRPRKNILASQEKCSGTCNKICPGSRKTIIVLVGRFINQQSPDQATRV